MKWCRRIEGVFSDQCSVFRSEGGRIPTGLQLTYLVSGPHPRWRSGCEVVLASLSSTRRWPACFGTSMKSCEPLNTNSTMADTKHHISSKLPALLSAVFGAFLLVWVAEWADSVTFLAANFVSSFGAAAFLEHARERASSRNKLLLWSAASFAFFLLGPLFVLPSVWQSLLHSWPQMFYFNGAMRGSLCDSKQQEAIAASVSGYVFGAAIGSVLFQKFSCFLHFQSRKHTHNDHSL